MKSLKTLLGAAATLYFGATAAQADIDTFFNNATRDYPVNGAILDSARNFQDLLDKMYDLSEDHPTEEDFKNRLYAPYANEMYHLTPGEIIAHDRNKNGPLDKEVEPCIGLAVANFQEQYLAELRLFIRDNDIYSSLADLENTLTQLEKGVYFLKEKSFDALDKETDPKKKYCNVPVASFQTNASFTMS